MNKRYTDFDKNGKSKTENKDDFNKKLKTYKPDRKSFDKPFREKKEGDFKPNRFEKKPYNSDDRKSFDKPFREKKEGDFKPNRFEKKPYNSDDRKSFDKPFREKKEGDFKPNRFEKKPYNSNVSKDDSAPIRASRNEWDKTKRGFNKYSNSTYGTSRKAMPRRDEISLQTPIKNSNNPDADLQENVDENAIRLLNKKNFRPYTPKLELTNYGKKKFAGTTKADRTEEENRAYMQNKMSKIDEYPDEEIKEELNARKLSYKPRARDAEGVLTDDSDMPLNKFIAHCGICSRREAVDLIKTGKIKVNNKAVLEPGFKINVQSDKVEFDKTTLQIKKALVYILLNKPKDYITTSDDPQERKTVLELVKHATEERVYPVGRLDRNTTGVLLLTNDGALTQKLTHPKYEIMKIYQVTLDKDITKRDFDAIINGVELEDGVVNVDALSYVDNKEKNQLGIEIHSGRNRIIRRLFEKLGYEVVNLDRVLFGGLTKKNVNRGKWRLLNEKEVVSLKFLNASKGKKNSF